MNSTHGFPKNLFSTLFVVLISVAPFFSKAQNLKTTDFIMYGKNVQISTSSSVLAGAVGAKSLILTTGNVTFGGGLFSDSAIVLNNNNTVNGLVKANNSGGSLTTGTAISTGSSAVLKDSVVARGGINIKGGTIKIAVLPSASTYVGPNPFVQKPDVSPYLPVMPPMPTTMSSGIPDITKNITNNALI